jgi:ABC-type nickel/cobalt efflux system permease component RcnA
MDAATMCLETSAENVKQASFLLIMNVAISTAWQKFSKIMRQHLSNLSLHKIKKLKEELLKDMKKQLNL